MVRKFFRDLAKVYKGTFDLASRYWSLYGGCRAFILSPFLHFSLIISLLCWQVWKLPKPPFIWYDMCASVLPNLLGFTLGGYAIFLAFGDQQFLRKIGGANESSKCKKSPLLGVSATLFHFIVVQVVTLTIAIIASSWEIKSGFLAWLGFTLFIYSIGTALAAGMAIFRLSRWFDLYISAEKKKNQDCKSDEPKTDSDSKT
jgi:hypothetical protein